MSPAFKSAVDQFFKSRQIAVLGYSNQETSPGRMIYDKLKNAGFHVYAVNPKQPLMQDGWCYQNLVEINSPIDGIIICSPPEQSLKIVREAHLLDVKTVWMHRSLDNGSYAKEAEDYCHTHDITCISFGCPMMFLEPDLGHQCMRWFFNIRGKFTEDYVDTATVAHPVHG